MASVRLLHGRLWGQQQQQQISEEAVVEIQVRDAASFNYGIGHDNGAERSDSRFIHSFHKYLLPTVCQALSEALEHTVEWDR